jgi:hypothetical protein
MMKRRDPSQRSQTTDVASVDEYTRKVIAKRHGYHGEAGCAGDGWFGVYATLRATSATWQNDADAA